MGADYNYSVVPSPRRGKAEPSMASLRDGMARINLKQEEYALPESKPSMSREGSKRDLDRFVPSRPSLARSSSTLDTDGESSTNTSFAESSASISAPNRRILSFRAAPPPASHATSHLDAQRNYLLHTSVSANRGTTTAGPAAGSKKRTVPFPERALDAPGFEDDYYLNLVDWSCANRVAIGLGTRPYVWDAETGDVLALEHSAEEENTVCSVAWSPDGVYLGVGNDAGQIEIWDVEETKRMRVMGGHNARVGALSWHGHVLSSGCRDGTIFHHDVRIAQHKTAELRGHTAEVCGLKWRADGQLLASGGNDNVVNCWDSRVGANVMSPADRIVPKWTKRNHTAAVKALAWCPWQPNLLASGGGSQDQHIHFWSTTTGARTASLAAGSQVTSLIWSPHAKEILSTHGYPNNNISLWSYPSLTKIYDVPAHDQRVLACALSPDGCKVATAAADENLKFWTVWEPKAIKKVDQEERAGRVRIR